MTRAEELRQYLIERNIGLDSLEANSIGEGIEWADKNPVNPWHKVSEGLPEDRVFLARTVNNPQIIKILEYSSVANGFWTSTGGFISKQDAINYYTHWMPIPELPKEE